MPGQAPEPGPSSATERSPSAAQRPDRSSRRAGRDGCAESSTIGREGVSHDDVSVQRCEAIRDRVAGYVALTFDDGPTPATLPLLLDRLRAAGAKATFFNLGSNAEAEPDLVRAQRDAGMWIGNHSETHPRLTELSEPAAFEEISRTQRILRRITGERPSLFRPPYGETDERVRAQAARLGVLEVLWTVDSRDWAGATTDDIVAAARTLRPGDILLMHDWAQAAVDALPQILTELRARGLRPGKIAYTPRRVPFGHTSFHATAAAP